LAKDDSIARQQLDTRQSMVDQLIAQIKGDKAAIDNAETAQLNDSADWKNGLSPGRSHSF